VPEEQVALQIRGRFLMSLQCAVAREAENYLNPQGRSFALPSAAY